MPVGSTQIPWKVELWNSFPGRICKDTCWKYQIVVATERKFSKHIVSTMSPRRYTRSNTGEVRPSACKVAECRSRHHRCKYPLQHFCVDRIVQTSLKKPNMRTECREDHSKCRRRWYWLPRIKSASIMVWPNHVQYCCAKRLPDIVYHIGAFVLIISHAHLGCESNGWCSSHVARSSRGKLRLVISQRILYHHVNVARYHDEARLHCSSSPCRSGEIVKKSSACFHHSEAVLMLTAGR